MRLCTRISVTRIAILLLLVMLALVAASLVLRDRSHLERSIMTEFSTRMDSLAFLIQRYAQKNRMPPKELAELGLNSGAYLDIWLDFPEKDRGEIGYIVLSSTRVFIYSPRMIDASANIEAIKEGKTDFSPYGRFVTCPVRD
jgi:hypothetical protein